MYNQSKVLYVPQFSLDMRKKSSLSKSEPTVKHNVGSLLLIQLPSDEINKKLLHSICFISNDLIERLLSILLNICNNFNKIG